MRKLLFILFVFAAIISFAQPAPGIALNGSVNNATIDTCGVGFFDSGGHELNC